ncbi:MAG: hypothetical protein K0S44_619 [Bacteroidetes bacterium]|jgi:hypothetical protein|nr:hypothetical protein [Bacteroidota bacterium]
MKKNSFIIIVWLFVSSCSFVIKKWGGIKDPKMESYLSINQYSKSLNIDSTLIVFAKDSTSQVKLNRYFLGGPELLVFSGQKLFYPYKNDSSTCNAPIDNTLANICSINSNGINTKRNISIDSIFNCFIDPNKVLDHFEYSRFDFIVLMNYAKYFDGINKTHIPDWNAIINKGNSGCNVKYIYVNLDYLDSWGISKKSLPKLRIKAS